MRTTGTVRSISARQPLQVRWSPSAHVALEKGLSKKAATQRHGTREGRKTAKGSKAKPRAPKKTGAPRAWSKGAKILEMIGKGATLAEIMKAADWQAHSVRGFICSTAKKQGIKIESTKNG